MIVARDRETLAAALADLRAGGARVGFVPTMGYLHEGHLSLVDRAREAADRVVVSIFVNPLQFGPGEDLDRYPRDLERDLDLCGRRDVDLVFAPADEAVIYPDGAPLVTVDPGPLAERLCGRYRPGHFRGVLTVVARLFGLVRPDVAVFGRKDFQQGVLVRRMVADLELGVDVRMAPIVREPDGLALSSRNTYLTPAERADAVGLVEGLRAALAAFAEGERSPMALVDAAAREIARREALELQYAEVVGPHLEPVPEADADSVLALAAFCGSTRLIDNAVLGEEAP
ncbi:MAG: pantoate--beta-alanine ligase [Gemmatimonadetes bacterium]|nr:MAG: pantoate--beta-alanine ligase [Gemmatimonadota bacterium]